MSLNASAIEIPQTPKLARQTAFGCPRDFLGNRFVYAVISPRARGLSIGVNMNPDRFCNFDCPYCEVSRTVPSTESHLDLDVMASELQKTLAVVRSGEIRHMSFFCAVPSELLKLQHVALSGDGEPTLCPNFNETVQSVVHVRARGPFFKLVLITNATGLDAPEVQSGLKYFTSHDEVWVKLDAGSDGYMQKINCPTVPLQKVLENIALIGRKRPVVVQSLFPSINGQEPAPEEIDEYVTRLAELKAVGTQISLVQIYSATRPIASSQCGHLPLKTLSRIAQAVRSVTGLNAEVF